VPGPWVSTRLGRLALAGALAAAAAFGAHRVLRHVLAPEIVRDAAGLLDPEQRDAIEDQHAFLRGDHGIDYRVETVRGAGDLDRFAVERFAELGVGRAGRGGRGLLLVIDPEADEVRLEVGRALEGVFPDAFVAYVEHRQMVPFLRAGRVGDGVLATTELLVGQVQRARASGGLAELPADGSGGAGARTRARIGAGPDPALRAGPDVAAGDSPEATVASYVDAMAARNGNPELDLYSEATRAMLRRHVMTPGQMDNLVRSYRDCRQEPARLAADGTRAVLRYPPDARRCAPWLLVREAGRWRLDLATASAAIRFGRDNSWRFAAGAEHPYAFAFDDWSFDDHGFPRG
jgi:uncharacterized protein